RNPAMGPEELRNWGPICASIWDPDPRLGPGSPGDRVAVHRDLHKKSNSRRPLQCWRLPSITATDSARVMPPSSAISFKLFQNSSSRLTLVLWPAMTIERFEIRDFTASPPQMSQR